MSPPSDQNRRFFYVCDGYCTYRNVIRASNLLLHSPTRQQCVAFNWYVYIHDVLVSLTAIFAPDFGTSASFLAAE